MVMNVIVLAAGMGTRLGAKGKITPRPLLPLGKGCVLDEVITSIWVDGITSVNVIHNNHSSDEAGDWPKSFKKWKKGIEWTPESGKQKKDPYIKLLNNGVSNPQADLGVVGDLSCFIRKLRKRDEPLLVVSPEDLYRDPHLRDLKGVFSKGKTSSITVRSVNDLEPIILTSKPPQVVVDGGIVAEIGDEIGGTPWRFCGPMYLAGKDVEFVTEYVDTWRKAGVIPDSLSGLVDSMINDGREVRAIKIKSHYWSVGTEELYRVACMRRASVSRHSNTKIMDRLRAGQKKLALEGRKN